MRLLGIDIETTGLDFEKDAVTEIGWVLCEAPLSHGVTPLSIQSFLIQTPTVISAEITKLTGITREAVDEFGQDFKNIIHLLNTEIAVHKVDYIVAQNGENFDKLFLQAECNKHNTSAHELFSRTWIDTAFDLPPGKFRYNNLMSMAAEIGVINHFKHRAVFDVMTMLTVLSHCNLDDVLVRASSPWVVVKAEVNFEQKELAKKRRYSWQMLGSELYPKSWVKKVKTCDLEKEKAEAPFPVVEY